MANEPLHRWLAWFDRINRPELAEEVINMDRDIATAEATLNELLNDEDFMRYYEMRQRAAWELNSMENDARRAREEAQREGVKEGKKAGLKEGIKEGKYEIARKLKARGRPLIEIAEDTGLPPDEIEKI